MVKEKSDKKMEMPEAGASKLAVSYREAIARQKEIWTCRPTSA